MKAARTLLMTAMVLGAAWTAPAMAHCDTLDGPVVAAGRAALATGQVERALIWVRTEDERGVKAAFAKARDARAKGAAVDGPRDTQFYTALVSAHRRGEGEPFTGLKPAGSIVPAVAATDAALAHGNPHDLESLLIERVRAGLGQRYEAALHAREFDPRNVEAGRAYVQAYVALVHYAERLQDIAEAPAHARADAHAAQRPKAPAAAVHAH